MKVLLVLVGVIAAASAVSFFELVHEEWKSFKVSSIIHFNLFKSLHRHYNEQYKNKISPVDDEMGMLTNTH